MPKPASDVQLRQYLQAEQARIYRLAYTYMRSPQDALDVVQSAIVKALAAPPLREPEHLRTWVYRIVVNTALDCLRQRQRVDLTDDWSAVTDSALTVDSRAALEGEADLLEALDRLPAELRAIVVLHYFHDLPLHEVAEVLDANLNTVKTRLYRALRLLRVEMEEQDA